MSRGLVADIGGTNARFAIVEAGEASTLQNPRFAKCADHPTIREGIEDYLSDVAGDRPDRAVLAIAGPIMGDIVVQNNGPWHFSVRALRDDLGLSRLDVVNDFIAMAHGVAALPDGRFADIGGCASQDEDQTGPWLVVGPGTGLGVASILEPRGALRVLGSEGGHVGFAPSDELEILIAQEVLKQNGQLSWEGLISGPGLQRLHKVMSLIDGRTPDPLPLSAEEITRRAIENDDEFARTVLERFCLLLGSAVGDMALMISARRVCLVGNIIQAIMPILRAGGFRERFDARGRYGDVLDAVPTVTVSGNDVGLTGAADILRKSQAALPPAR